MQGLANAWPTAIKNSSAAPVTAATSTQGSITCLLWQTTPMPPAAAKAPHCYAQLAEKAAQAPATKAPAAEPIDKQGTASAAEVPTTDVQLGSKSSNH